MYNSCVVPSVMHLNFPKRYDEKEGVEHSMGKGGPSFDIRSDVHGPKHYSHYRTINTRL